MTYEVFIGLRYLRSSRSHRLMSLTSTISILGIAIGVAVLVVVLSVMNGFEQELRSRILSLTPHATITALGPRLPNWETLAAKIREDPEILSAAPYVEKLALLIASSNSSVAALTGVLPAKEHDVSAIAEKIATGSLESLVEGEYGILLGSELAEALEVSIGGRVVVVTAQRTVTPAGIMPRRRVFKVIGTFSSGMYEFDRNVAYVHLADAARLYQMGQDVTGLRLKLTDMFAASRVVGEVASSLGRSYYVDNWTNRHANLFRSIQLTKSALFLILLLLVGVATFNMVSTLVMAVKMRKAEIAILRTIGAAPRNVLAIFVIQGIAIGVTGTVSGLLLGMIVALNIEVLIQGLQVVLGIKFLDAKVYYISDLPTRIQWADMLKISGTALCLCSLSTLYPSWHAARTHPTEALRHE